MYFNPFIHPSKGIYTVSVYWPLCTNQCFKKTKNSANGQNPRSPESWLTQRTAAGGETS